MYRGHSRAATSAWQSITESRKYRSTSSWMWGQVTQDFCPLVEHLIFIFTGIDGKCSKEKSSLVSWACRREAQGGGSSRDFWNLLLRCASAPRNYFVAPLAAVGSPEKTGGLRKLVLGKLCEGTDCHVRHGLWLCWAGLATITHVSCLRWFPGVLFTM